MAKQTLLAAKTAKKISELIPQQRNSRQSKHKSRQNQTNTRHNNETHSKINPALGK